MRSYLLIFSLMACLFSGLQAQNVGINTDGSSPDASAILDVKSTDRGLLVPRMSLSDVTSASPVTSPATGLIVYNTNASVTGGNGTGFYYWNGSQWVRLDAGNSGDWHLTGNAGTSPTTNFLGTTDAQDLVFRTNNNERMRILSGGNVGIGTTTPGHVLHVIETGNSVSVHGIYINETNEGQALGIDEFGNGAGILINSNNEGSAIYSTVNGAVTSNAVGFFLYDNRTSSTPSITKIGADIQSTGTWSGSGSSNTGINLVASGGSTNVGINVSVSGGTTNYAGLFNGGNVGIGTTTPGHLLHVLETGNDGAVAGLQVDETNAGQALVINESGNGAGILVTANDNGAAIQSTAQGAVTASFTGHTFSDIRTSSTASVTKTAVAINSTGTWDGSGSVNRGLTVDVSGGTTNYAALFNGGNVGIGTTTPNTNLDVVGGASAAETRLLTVRSNFTANNTGSAIALINSTSSSSNVGAELAAITTNASTGASQLVFRTHGGGGSFGALNERMRLTNEGRLGIGTNAPLDMLHVDNSAVGASSARIGRTASQFDNRLFFGDGSNVYVGELNADNRLYLRGSTISIDINGSLGGANGRVLTSNGTTVSWQPPVPIGAIIAWVNHLTGTPALPPGWVECNGGTVSDPESPINGQPIPNLNGAVTSTFGATDGGRYLRGTTGTTGGTQADRVPNFNIEQDATNSGCGNCVITADGASTAWSPYLRNYYLDDRFRIRYNGGEVRPVSYTVRWIMRIK